MGGLAVQNFVVGGRRHRRAHRGRCAGFARARRLGHRQLLGRPHAHDPLRPAADLRRSARCSSSRRASSRRSRLARRSGRSPADRRPWPSARSPRRRSSRSWAPTAAASSTSTPRCRSRTRTAFTNFVADARDPRRSRRGSRPRSGAWSAAAARAGRSTCAMTVLFVAGVAIVYVGREPARPRRCTPRGLVGGNMEGKEQRFGIGSSSLFAAVTTVASCGAVNAAMESLTGLGRRRPARQHRDRRGRSSAASARASTGCCCSSCSRCSSPG